MRNAETVLGIIREPDIHAGRPTRTRPMRTQALESRMLGNVARPVRRGVDGKVPGNGQLASSLPYTRLARAFVRDAALIILDEPTAALDADAEYQLFQRFRELIAGKTALLIKSRLLHSTNGRSHPGAGRQADTGK